MHYDAAKLQSVQSYLNMPRETCSGKQGQPAHTQWFRPGRSYSIRQKYSPTHTGLFTAMKKNKPPSPHFDTRCSMHLLSTMRRQQHRNVQQNVSAGSRLVVDRESNTRSRLVFLVISRQFLASPLSPPIFSFFDFSLAKFFPVFASSTSNLPPRLDSKRNG